MQKKSLLARLADAGAELAAGLAQLRQHHLAQVPDQATTRGLPPVHRPSADRIAPLSMFQQPKQAPDKSTRAAKRMTMQAPVRVGTAHEDPIAVGRPSVQVGRGVRVLRTACRSPARRARG